MKALVQPARLEPAYSFVFSVPRSYSMQSHDMVHAAMRNSPSACLSVLPWLSMPRSRCLSNQCHLGGLACSQWLSFTQQGQGRTNVLLQLLTFIRHRLRNRWSNSWVWKTCLEWPQIHQFTPKPFWLSCVLNQGTSSWQVFLPAGSMVWIPEGKNTCKTSLFSCSFKII